MAHLSSIVVVVHLWRSTRGGDALVIVVFHCWWTPWFQFWCFLSSQRTNEQISPFAVLHATWLQQNMQKGRTGGCPHVVHRRWYAVTVVHRRCGAFRSGTLRRVAPRVGTLLSGAHISCAPFKWYSFRLEHNSERHICCRTHLRTENTSGTCTFPSGTCSAARSWSPVRCGLPIHGFLRFFFPLQTRSPL